MVALPTNVSVLIGKVKVPVFTIVEITGEVSVLLVKVSVVALPTKVSVLVGRVRVPVLRIDDIVGVVSVLFVRVSVVDLPTRVSVLVGKVKVPVLIIVEIVGVVMVGEELITNVDPVPVCELTDVVLPIDVMGPVRLALVVTVDAFPDKVAVIVPAEKLPEASLRTAVEAVFVLVNDGTYDEFQDAIPVPVIKMHVNMAEEDPIIVVIVLLPDDCIVIEPVELFTI